MVMGLVFYTFGEQMIKSYQMQKEVSTLETQISGIEKKNIQLKQMAKDLETDAYVEKIAREKLGLVKQGEKIILRANPGDITPVQKGKTSNLRD